MYNKLTNPETHCAFDPEACIFVSANAGSGKTSLLANRVLSLLLHGVEPGKILCLTFTNAAATEMSGRILKALGSWVMADDAELKPQIEKITGNAPNADLLSYARGLFASVLESPQGVNIQTIHGFCQSLLRRFPLEANVSPHFTVMDGRSEQEALTEARLRLFNHARKGDGNIGRSLDSLARVVSESGFQKLMNEIVANKRKFRYLFQNIAGEAQFEIGRILCGSFKIPADATCESLVETHFNYTGEELLTLREISGFLLKSTKATDIKTGAQLAGWLENSGNKMELVESYAGCFLTKDGSPLKRIFTKNALPDSLLEEALLAEQKRVCEYSDRLNAFMVVRHSLEVLHIAEVLLAQYEAIKRSHGWMDYDDLILTASNLLTRSGMSQWVLFKLDGGIDHILVDEAQDTSPEQWRIVDALTQEFFAGQGARETYRSLFIVGDEKQSIFSFQGADVKELARMQKYFDASIKAAEIPFHFLSLTNSYRSTDAVLQAVDAVFARQEARAGVTFSESAFTHIPTRSGQPGVVELWPLIKPPEDENEEESEGEINLSTSIILVRHIADRIKGWIGSGEARAGDIMILLRSRTRFADRLVRALKRRGVPVAGSDRMALNDNLAVQDLIALGQVLLLPEDDLTLAACLKSPIFNLSEDDLFTLAYDRNGQSLWQRLGKLPQFAGAYELLTDLRARADFIPTFELYSLLLDVKGARARFLGRMGEECADPINEFMQQILLYESSHPPSLQGFLHWLLHSDSVIKRDMEQSRDMVRIMTIHGAKGLQSKIVILPDTVQTPKEQGSLFLLKKDGYEIPMRSISSGQDDAVFKKLRHDLRQETLSEYRRLLYVALTRAEDRLYIYGAAGKNKISEQSWYHHIKTGLEPLATPFATPFGEGLRVGVVAAVIPAQAGISLPSGLMADRDSRLHGNGNINLSFLQSPAPDEPSPSKPLAPSRLPGELPATASPLSGKNIYAAGKFIHLLLQYLPAQEPSRREPMAIMLAGKFKNQLDENEINRAIADVSQVINDPSHAFLFTPDSLAEVPITGNLEISGKNITVSGQIDRLCIRDGEAWIVDFKSNQLPPERQRDIPVSYIRQLALYRLLLQKIMPEKHIYCALLWTANAKLDVLPDALLDEWQASSYI